MMRGPVSQSERSLAQAHCRPEKVNLKRGAHNRFLHLKSPRSDLEGT